MKPPKRKRGDLYAEALKKPNADEAVAWLWEQVPEDMCKHPCIEVQVRKRFIKPIPTPVFLGPFAKSLVDAATAYESAKATKTLHLWGPPGTGKSSFAKTLFTDFTLVRGSLDSLKLTPPWRRQLPIVFDDVDFKSVSKEDLKSCCDVVDGGSIRVLYGTYDIPPGVPRVILSNRLFFWGGGDVDEAILERRLISFKIDM